MKILVVNGSPKGKYSITLQTVLYLEKLFPQHTFEILHAGQTIRALEKDFTPAKQVLEACDLILFSYPVYTFIAPSQLHRFIELIKASGVNLTGKYATQFTTSKHFYDVTAHRYTMENMQDCGVKFIRGLSADMDDLTKPSGQKDAQEFFKRVVWSVETDTYEPFPAPQPETVRIPVHPAESSTEKSGDVVILADLAENDGQLGAMIDRFRSKLNKKTRVVNLREYPFQGGCLGCFNCNSTGKCVYKDGFDSYLRDTIQTANAIVVAFTIRDHSMGSIIKTYDDRQFCNGHRTVTMGMPTAYIVSGRYSAEENLRTIIEARSEVGGNYLAGVATDETDTDASIDSTARALDYAIDHAYTQPANFYGVGGMKIFRDLIYKMRGMMKADHKFYKAHGQYDFPQKERGTILKMYLVGALLSSPKVKRKMGSKMTEGMLAPYRKVLDSVVKNDDRK